MHEKVTFERTEDMVVVTFWDGSVLASQVTMSYQQFDNFIDLCKTYRASNALSATFKLVS